MSKVCSRWVPRFLKDHVWETRVRCLQKFVHRYDREGEEFLNRIVPTQSCIWKIPGTPPPKKARVQKSGGKHMFMFFMDRKGMILQHQVPDDQTVTASYYSKVLRRDLMQA
ncbi:uncharacterized protein LOC128234837 [Mya arenaria]|uniref:uncharacterized protein LOC128234837 n=1 Tax=Mya arenaria TaxID=6604 RepID=UPI0022E5E8F6|nr:uncharacterized protein LOC128234837 [Mya arenaria]